MLNADQVKKDFPVLRNNKSLVYLDSTATALKPYRVIKKIDEYYKKYSANVFRGIYRISEKATKEFEDTRSIVSKFINAEHEEIIFTRNTTESLNLIAYSLGREVVGNGDNIVTSVMEHHSNFVPWQMLCFENGASLKVLDINENGLLQADRKVLNKVITRKTKIFALTCASNVLGTINPVKSIISDVRRINPNTIIVLDCAQYIPHSKIDVKEIGADFIAFSSHKMLGPTGVGVLWGKKSILEHMMPFQFGGEMIEQVSLQKTTFAKPPFKFEAGTPHIAGVIGLKEAVLYLQDVGFDKIKKHEEKIVKYFFKRIQEEFGNDVKVVGPKNSELRSPIFSFTFLNFHPHDIAQILDEENIAVRAGHHCAMPLHQRLSLIATTRASFYIYNTIEDVESLIQGLKRVKKVLR